MSPYGRLTQAKLRARKVCVRLREGTVLAEQRSAAQRRAVSFRK